MRELPIVERLRERSLELQSTAWSRMDGGQECSLSATLVDEAADTIAALYEELADLVKAYSDFRVGQGCSPDSTCLTAARAALSLALGESPNA